MSGGPEALSGITAAAWHPPCNMSPHGPPKCWSFSVLPGPAGRSGRAVWAHRCDTLASHCGSR